MDDPLTIKDVESAKIKRKNDVVERWSGMASQGHGIKEFRGDSLCNQWLYRPYLLRSSRFKTAMQLRTNTIGIKTILSRAGGGPDVACRHCHAWPETLAHVLGQCTATKDARIHRHDEIVGIVAEALAHESRRVEKEPSITIGGVTWKPDIVLYDRVKRKVNVYDVTIRYERDDALLEAAREKISKYKDVAKFLADEAQYKRWQVFPIVLGSRGAIPLITRQVLQDVGFGKKDLLSMSLMALRSSIEISHAFLDYVQGRRGRRRGD